MQHKIIIKRDKIWQQVRRLKRFTVKDIATATNTPVNEVRTFLNVLINGGYLQKNEGAKLPKVFGGINAVAYQLVKDNGMYYPELSPNGRRKKVHPSQKIWMAIKARPRGDTFSAVDVSLWTGVSKRYSQEYCQLLCKGEYLFSANEDQYRVNHKVGKGPRAPLKMENGNLFDRNLHQVIVIRKVAS